MPIRFKDKEYRGWYELYRNVFPKPAVDLKTSYSRFRSRRITNSEVSDEDIEEILYLSKPEYRERYGKRKTIVFIDNMKFVLEEYYRKLQSPVANYSVFRQRVKSLEKRYLLDNDSMRDAYSMDRATWMSFYGGGRRRQFVYDGDIYKEHKGKAFSSIAAFMRTIGENDKKGTVWNRLKAGWSLDDALSEPVVTLGDRDGIIYVLRNTTSGRKYVGLTVTTPNSRLRQHIKTALELNGSSELHKSIREFGPKSFKIEKIEENIPQHILPEREKYWIEELDTLFPNGLNTSPGGQMGGGRGKKIIYEGRTFNSLTEASITLSLETGLAEHVILRRIEAGEKLPKKARTASKHPDAGSNLWRRWKSIIRTTKLDLRPGSVSKVWLDYNRFKRDVAPGFSPELNLVRISEKKSWGSNNFKWVSVQERVELTHGKTYSIGGRKYSSLEAVSREFGIGVTTLRDRIKRQGLTLEKAVNIELGPTSYRTRKMPIIVDGIEFPTRNQAAQYAEKKYKITIHQAKDRIKREVPLDKPNHAKKCLIDGIHFLSESAAARHHGVKKGTFGKRRSLGWSLEQALGIAPPPKRKSSKNTKSLAS